MILYNFYAGDYDKEWGTGTVSIVYMMTDDESDYLEMDEQIKAQFLGYL